MSTDLDKLQLLSLVSKLTTEINNHIDINDKALAEYIVDIHENVVNSLQKPVSRQNVLNPFEIKLQQVGAEFPKPLIQHINDLIFRMHPKLKGISGTNDVKNGTSTVLNGLAIKDSIQMDNKNYSQEIKNNRDLLDDEMDKITGFAENSSPNRTVNSRFSRDRSRSPEYNGSDYNGPRQSRQSRNSDNYRNSDDYGYTRQRHSSEYTSRRQYSPDHSPQRGRSPDNNRQRHHTPDNYPQRRHSPDNNRERRHSPDNHSHRHRRPRSPPRPSSHQTPPWHKQSSASSAIPAYHDEQYPIVGKTYDARIEKLTNYGAFASLEGFSNISGLIHISKLANQHVNHPGDIVQCGEIVKVKVLRIENSKISLSMRDVEDTTAIDQPNKKRKRLTSPERWELRQLISSGAISATDYPELQSELNGNDQENSDNEAPEMEEDIDIELNEEEPPFLAGQTHQSLELSPIRVVKAPDGSLNRAAMTGATYAKERREKRQEEARAKDREEKSRDRTARSLEQDPLAPIREDAGENTNEDLSYSTETHALTWKKPVKQTFGKRSDLPIDVQRKSLPVYQLREQVIQAVRDNQILIVVGDTGSGKTTQITQYLNEEGFTVKGLKIGCTQPRRVAAVSVAKRVAEEMGTKVGNEVGYTIRFEDCTKPYTKIKYMTDGMLQREALIDPDMSQYSVIMLDEAHERTIATDVLFALLKKAAKRRPDLKLIVTSATLDSEKFSKYFWDCPILFIPGRTFPVSIEYVREPEMDYLDATLSTIVEIHLSEPLPGDILVFLTGQEEIDTSCEALEQRMKRLKETMGANEVPNLIVLPVYSALPSEMQSRIFEPAPANARKVILATNIAETSVTIDGIYYVVDPGFVKINAYDPKLGMDSLIISPISQAQANQRAGRAGRTGPGKCFRLYTQSAYEKEMLPNTIPEIQRQNLSNSILMLKAMGINDLLHFDFMDPPPTNTMLSALEELYQLSALDDEGLLTRLGRRMADFPMEPAMAKVLLTSVDAHCSEEMLTIVAMLSVQTIFYRPNDKKEQAGQKHAKFKDSSGDHITLLNVYSDWQRSDYSRQWCTTNFIQERSLKRAKDVRRQLVQIMRDRHKYKLESCGNKTDNVRKALCAGYFRNSARKDPQEGYKTLVESTPVFMHPSSALFFKPAEYVIYHTLLLTSKEYMNCVTTIDPKWLVEAAPHFFKVANGNKLSKRKQNETIQPLKSRFSQDQNGWRLSAQKKLIQSAQKSGFG